MRKGFILFIIALLALSIMLSGCGEQVGEAFKKFSKSRSSRTSSASPAPTSSPATMPVGAKQRTFEQGCCEIRSSSNCMRASSASDCPSAGTFHSETCEEVSACDIVACCSRYPSAMYRTGCENQNVPMHRISGFEQRPPDFDSQARSLCR